MDEDNLKRILVDAGCLMENIERILKNFEAGHRDDMLKLIKKERTRAMDEYHESGRKVDRMDFVIRNLEKEMKRKA